MKKPEPSKKQCKKCKYIWTYRGKRKYFCCPNCMTSSQHPDVEVMA